MKLVGVVLPRYFAVQTFLTKARLLRTNEWAGAAHPSPIRRLPSRPASHEPSRSSPPSLLRAPSLHSPHRVFRCPRGPRDSLRLSAPALRCARASDALRSCHWRHLPTLSIMLQLRATPHCHEPVMLVMPAAVDAIPSPILAIQ